MHRLKKTVTALLLVFSMILSFSTVAFAATTGTVTDDCVRIHTEPEGSSEAYQQVNKGDTLTVLKEADEYGWVQVSFVYTATGETKTGYISSDYLKIAGESSKTESTDKSSSSDKSTSKDTSNKSDSSDKSTSKDTSSKSDSSDKSTSKDTADKSDSSDSSSESESADKSSSSDKTESTDKEETKEEETAAIASSVSYTATVTDSGVRIRKKASTKSDILTTVPEGAIVTVLSTEDKNGWMRVRYYDEDGKKYKGYMSGEYLDINAIGKGVSRVVNAIVRESADPTSAITGVVPLNKEVDIYASENNWYKVEYQDLSGWVHSDCIRTESDDTCVGYATVQIDDLNLREKQSLKSDILNTIPKGVVLQITDNKKEGWYGVTYNGVSGYVSADYVETSSHATSGYVQVTATSLTLRSGAGTEYTRLTIIPQGKLLEVKGSVGAWYQVSYGKYTGYVSGAFVSATTKYGFQAYPDYAEITADALTLRKKATTDSDAITSIPGGAVVAVSGLSNGWYKVTYGGLTGYVDSTYVERSTEAAHTAYEEAVRAYEEAVRAAEEEARQKAAAAEAEAAAAEAAAAEAAAAEAAAQESASTTTTSSSSSGSSVLSYASQFVGNPYSWGGTSLTNGADCSGFVKSVFAHFGISLPHSSSAIRSYGKSVSYSDMQPGDIVCYSGHVGIYAGNGQLLSALNKKSGITYCSVNYKSIITIRRMS
jgi:uncharacterized protein YgiM (DUF1202 family)